MLNDKEFWLEAIKIILDYYNCTQNSTQKVVEFTQPEILKKHFDFTLPKQGQDQQQILNTIKQYLKYSVHTNHKQFANQLWSGVNTPGILGELFSALANTSMYTYEVAPVATLMEHQLLKRVAEIVGFTSSEGIFTTGSSQGNLLAMLLARNNCINSAKKSGLHQSQKLVAFVSEDAHYSFATAANLLGIGTDNLIKITTNPYGEMDCDQLLQAIEHSINENNLPFFVGATAGTTVRGAFDNCLQTAALAKKHKLWFHIDAAFGGAALFHANSKNLLLGCEQANSITLDMHKTMGVPLICSIFLTVHAGLLKENCSNGNQSYIFHGHDYAALNQGPHSIQCGRRVDALKLWLTWQYYGDEGFSTRVAKLLELAAYMEKQIQAHKELELFPPRKYLTVCFRYLPKNDTLNIDDLNLQVRDYLHEQGISLVNFAKINGNLVIRYVLAHPDTSKEDIDYFLENFIRTAKWLDCSDVARSSTISYPS